MNIRPVQHGVWSSGQTGFRRGASNTVDLTMVDIGGNDMGE